MAFLRSKNVHLFNQLPFEPAFNNLSRNWEPTDNYSDMPILENFYGKIFSSGLINTAYFLPDWKTSFGATWEYARARKLKIKTVVLRRNQLIQIQQ